MGTIIIVTGSGVLPFEDTQNSSFRAEAYGVASISWFITTLYRFFDLPLPSSIKWLFWCDNKGLVTRLNNQASSTHRLSDLTATDADMCLCANKGLSLIGNYRLAHIKGHQDSTKSRATLSVPAQLNIESDRLATLALKLSPSRHIPFMPGADVQFFIKRRHITTRFEQAIHFAATTPKLRLYMEDAYGWAPTTADLIDWDVHGASLKSLSDKHRLIILKFIHGWLPTSKQANRYSPGIPPQCPHCQHPSEDNYHFISCQHAGPKEQWQLFHKKLLRTLQKQHTEPTLQAMILFQLSSLLQIDSEQPIINERSETWYNDQLTIGWRHLLYGRISISMTDYQHDYLSLLPIDHRRHTGEIWGKRIISAIWQHVISLWHFRCDTMYGTSATDKIRVQKSQILHTVERLHSQKHLLPVEDHVLFPTLADLSRKRLSTLETWISMIEPLVNHYTHHPELHPALSQQRPLTAFFPRR